MPLRLERADIGEDFYVLLGAKNWACVEGYAAEWEAIAAALATRGRVSFKRCAVAPSKGGWQFWSPRNAHNDEDYVWIPESECDGLAAHILEVLP